MGSNRIKPDFNNLSSNRIHNQNPSNSQKVKGSARSSIMTVFRNFFFKGSVKTSTVVPNTELPEDDLKTESFRSSSKLTTMDKVDIVIESEKEKFEKKLSEKQNELRNLLNEQFKDKGVSFAEVERLEVGNGYRLRVSSKDNKDIKTWVIKEDAGKFILEKPPSKNTVNTSHSRINNFTDEDKQQLFKTIETTLKLDPIQLGELKANFGEETEGHLSYNPQGHLDVNIELKRQPHNIIIKKDGHIEWPDSLKKLTSEDKTKFKQILDSAIADSHVFINNHDATIIDNTYAKGSELHSFLSRELKFELENATLKSVNRNRVTGRVTLTITDDLTKKDRTIELSDSKPIIGKTPRFIMKGRFNQHVSKKRMLTIYKHINQTFFKTEKNVQRTWPDFFSDNFNKLFASSKSNQTKSIFITKLQKQTQELEKIKDHLKKDPVRNSSEINKIEKEIEKSKNLANDPNTLTTTLVNHLSSLNATITDLVKTITDDEKILQFENFNKNTDHFNTLSTLINKEKTINIPRYRFFLLYLDHENKSIDSQFTNHQLNCWSTELREPLPTELNKVVQSEQHKSLQNLKELHKQIEKDKVTNENFSQLLSELKKLISIDADELEIFELEASQNKAGTLVFLNQWITEVEEGLNPNDEVSTPTNTTTAANYIEEFRNKINATLSSIDQFYKETSLPKLPSITTLTHLINELNEIDPNNQTNALITISKIKTYLDDDSEIITHLALLTECNQSKNLLETKLFQPYAKAIDTLHSKVETLKEKQQPLQANLKNTLCKFLGISTDKTDKTEDEINQEIINLLEEDASAFKKLVKYEDSPEELSDALKTLIAGFSVSKTGLEHPRFQTTILNLANDNKKLPSFSYEENVPNPKPPKNIPSLGLTQSLGLTKTGNYRKCTFGESSWFVKTRDVLQKESGGSLKSEDLSKIKTDPPTIFYVDKNYPNKLWLHVENKLHFIHRDNLQENENNAIDIALKTKFPEIFTKFTSTKNIIDASTSPKAFKAAYETVKTEFQENLTMIGEELKQNDFEKLFNENPPFSESFYKDTPALKPISYIYGSEP